MNLVDIHRPLKNLAIILDKQIDDDFLAAMQFFDTRVANNHRLKKFAGANTQKEPNLAQNTGLEIIRGISKFTIEILIGHNEQSPSFFFTNSSSYN